jgi:hypothetical protein
MILTRKWASLCKYLHGHCKNSQIKDNPKKKREPQAKVKNQAKITPQLVINAEISISLRGLM